MLHEMTTETVLSTNHVRPVRTCIVFAAAAGATALVGLVWPAAFAVLTVVTLAIAGLVGSNLLSDIGISNKFSRRFAPVAGGLAYLAAVQLLDKWVAITVSAAMALLLVILRARFRTGLRGVRGSHPAQTWAEITYPVFGTVSLVIGWGIVGEKWLGFLPVAFMAWGDTAAGLARDTVSDDNSPTVFTMAAMFAVCLGAAAVFFRPFWIGAIGAAIATLAERYRPGMFGVWDDNVYIVAESLMVMGVLVRISS
jgi:hypothetical protein